MSDPKEPHDGDLYELAEDLDNEPAPPPAFVPATEPKAAPAPATPPSAAATPSRTPTPAESLANAEEPEYVSEDVKAMRREQQRIAAAEANAQKSLGDYKWLYLLAGGLVLLILLIWAMYGLGDAILGLAESTAASTTTSI